MSTRPDWDTYFMDMARLAERRSTCLRRRVGAVVAKDKMVMATGYNGTPKGVTHCEVTGCLREKLGVPSGQRHELCRGLHAEQNAIVQAAYHGVSIRGGTMYCTFRPCVICVKMIINAGLERVVFLGDYPDDLSAAMAAEAGLKMVRLTEPAGGTP
ncbi:MAG TPA: cytidine/deoxycytidylate deaminase family protein [Myxococcota bacterium]|nr:cytidine/deoxycytidylate deaminase family protein [Myxococcota bacterium]HRY94887.1 cytidine/deoxycytidylate deaminase family protein [Myxococcota bacterium]HSA22670.1 cytidine/deoxycytidylate deaminase family protein [Myxococcota bacterium]